MTKTHTYSIGASAHATATFTFSGYKVLGLVGYSSGNNYVSVCQVGAGSTGGVSDYTMWLHNETSTQINNAKATVQALCVLT